MPVSDPVVRHARREGVLIFTIWLTAAAVCCMVSYHLGYSTPERQLGPADLKSIIGIPAWVFWGYLVPWLVCGVLTILVAGFVMADDDLGDDHAEELDRDIREMGLDIE